MELKKIDTNQIKNQVYETCRTMIVSGSWKPGTKIPSENQLCEELGVSRVSVRAALQSLAAQGFIMIKRGEGSYVKKFSISESLDILQPIIALDRKDVMEVLEFRLMTEPYIMPLIIERVTPEDIHVLQLNLKNMKKSQHDLNSYTKLDEQFHLKLMEIVSNSVFTKVYTVLLEIFNSAWQKICKILGTESGVTYHTYLLAAIQNKNPDLATQIMKEHIEDTRNRVAEYYQKE